MAREHRYLDGKTGKLTIFPFTPTEETIADQKDAAAAAKDAAKSTPEARIDQAFTLGDKDHIIKAMFLEFENRISVLEGGTVKSEIETSLKAKLP